jgi:hypothetical protein
MTAHRAKPVEPSAAIPTVASVPGRGGDPARECRARA